MQFDYKSRLNSAMEMDSPIGQLLNKMSMDSVFYTNSTLKSPWAISLPAINQCMIFHLVLEGQVNIQVADEKVNLLSGDFALLPLGQGHVLSDNSGVQPISLEELPIKVVSDRYETLEYGGEGDSCRLICGAVTFKHPLILRLLGILPEIIQIKGLENSEAHIVHVLTKMLLNEVQSQSHGAEGVISKLAELLVISAIRQYIDEHPEKVESWFGALQDPRVAKAISLVHAKPSVHWSLEQLAREVGMSRTSFAVQFKKLVGSSPIDYLTEWRMSLAYSALAQSNDSILSIALECGYQSESAFSRAFKKVVGYKPSEIRKRENSHLS